MLKIWLAHTPNANDLFYCCFSWNWFFTQFTAGRIQYQISVLHAQAVNSRSSMQYNSNSRLTISQWCSPICNCYICEILHGGQSSICRFFYNSFVFIRPLHWLLNESVHFVLLLLSMSCYSEKWKWKIAFATAVHHSQRWLFSRYQHSLPDTCCNRTTTMMMTLMTFVMSYLL